MIEDVYPLSPLQEGLYYHWLNAPETPAYLMQTSYRLKEGFDISILKESYQRLIARHAVLRTFFTQEFGERLLQVVKKETEPVFIYIDATIDPGFSIADYKEVDRSKVFDLHSGSQVRLTVVNLGDNTYEFIWTHHHIIMDGWCTGVLLREFFQVYYTIRQGKEPVMGNVWPYSSYIEWLNKTDQQEALRYWRNYLSGYETPVMLPKTSTGKKQEYLAEETDFQVGGSLRQSIRALCLEAGVTENIFIQVAWAILLAKYNDTTDVVFGSVVSGRPAELPGVEEMVGMFINTIPVRVHTGQRIVIRKLLKETQQNYLEGLNYHYTQLAQIQTENGLGRGLFDHIIQFQNLPGQDKEKQAATSTGSSPEMPFSSHSAFGDNSYDFTCVIVPGSSTISFVFKYKSHLYNDGMIKRLQGHLLRIIEQITENSAIGIQEIDYLAPEEKQQLLTGFNNTSVPVTGKTPVALFDEQVRKNPDAIAILFDGMEFTYRQLSHKVDLLATYLKTTYQLKGNDLIGIMLDRSESVIVAMLAILKTGAAYVPIDPVYPGQRKEFILKDIGLKVLLTQTKYIFDLQYYNGDVFTMDAQMNELNSAMVLDETVIQPDDLAYVIYTSGSTGTPKGCGVTQRNLSHYIEWANSYYFSESFKPAFGFFTSLSFDLTITSIFCCLTKGGTLTIYNFYKELSEILTHSFNEKNQLTSIKLTPSHISLLKHLPISSSAISCAIAGGEEMTAEHVNILKRINPGIRIFNEYGPTETTVGCIVKELEKNAPVLIGKPISRTTVYILDKNAALCPIGVAGEIYIGGAGVARGYLNQPELTVEKFIPDPFKKGERLYKTGDTGVWLEDGDIEFLGRQDDQVKINGYRVELGEIENVLGNCPLVESTVVLARANKDDVNELVAYLVSDQPVDIADIRTYLAQTLPVYMIPNHYVRLDMLPLTANGKVDKKALPQPQGRGMGANAEYVAPRNEIEEKLVVIWQDILGKEKVGVKDNFFALGGHSLKVIQLISRINAAFSVRISVQNIFDDPTIENLYEQISFFLNQAKQEENTEKLVQVEI